MLFYKRTGRQGQNKVMAADSFYLFSPQKRRSAVVLSSPHSGAYYPEAFLQRAILDAHEIRSSEDAFVDQLIESGPSQGIAVLAARFPRAYVDLNRSVQELDPAMVEDVPRLGLNPRVASGLGVIPRVVAQGRFIQSGKMTLLQAQARLAQVWHPYHQQLQALLDHARLRHGCAILLDMHSMPREALDCLERVGKTRPEIVLGDRFGASADSEIVEQIEAIFAAQGFVVGRNSPFAGAYITQTYGRPARQQHAVQVEIDRSLYMDEATITPHGGFADVQARIAAALVEVACISGPSESLAAE